MRTAVCGRTCPGDEPARSPIRAGAQAHHRGRYAWPPVEATAAAISAPVTDIAATPDTGLTTAEVERRRREGLGNDVNWQSSRGYVQIFRENVFTFINIILFSLAVLLVIVGRPIDALISLAVVSTNVVVSVVQEIRAKRLLDKISLLNRPTATVIRDGSSQVVPPDDLVVGDLVEVTAGDQFVLDGVLKSGRLQADESLLTGESDLIPKGVGDEVFSGAFATAGGGRYVVQKVGSQSLSNRITEGARAHRRVLTPLQSDVNTVIRVTLLIVVYLELLLLVSSIVKFIPAPETVSQATVLAGLIPNGLFVSIAIAYALGAIRLLRVGALVQQSNAIESLSHVDVLCTDKTGTLTANKLTLTECVAFDGDSDSLKRIVGTIVASAAERNKTAEAIAEASPSDAVPTVVDVPFSSARKWSAVAFAADTDRIKRGSYVLGAPQMLRGVVQPAEDGAPTSWSSIEREIATRAAQGLRVLIVLWHPKPDAIGGTVDEPTLTAGFIPLGLVVLQDELRRDAGMVLERFMSSGVHVKIISGDDPDTVVSLAKQAGLTGELVSISGTELDAHDDAALAVVAGRTAVFGRVTPAQKERLVGALRGSGSYVAMIGDGVNDVLSLKRANLAVAMQSGSQATRSVADIILTDDSFAALAPAVEEGQRILNGMFDILSLFLSRISTMGIVILSSLVIGFFPIALRNASAVTLFSVGIPSALLAVWAQPGVQPKQTLAGTISRFVVPAAGITSLCALVVLFGSLWLEVTLRTPVGATSDQQTEIVRTSLPYAQSALTAFLVMAGLGLVIYVEPPLPWLAVIQPLSRDWRPTILAIVLAAVFVVLMAFGPLREIFLLLPPSWWTIALTGLVLLFWFFAVRFLWKHRVIERFVGG
jgi:cation-transporting ATPase E